MIGQLSRFPNDEGTFEGLVGPGEADPEFPSLFTESEAIFRELFLLICRFCKRRSRARRFWNQTWKLGTILLMRIASRIFLSVLPRDGESVGQR